MPPPPPAHSPRVPQAAAFARAVGKNRDAETVAREAFCVAMGGDRDPESAGNVWAAAEKGDTSLVGDHVLADDKCVNAKSILYDPPLLARLKMGAQVLFYFGRFNSLILVVK